MNNLNIKFSDLIGRFKTELWQDKKRMTVLVVALVVAGIIVGRLVVRCDPPSKASGAEDQSTDENAGAAPTPKNAWKHQRIDTASMDRSITRDVFWPDTRCFPLPLQTSLDDDVARQKKLDYARQLVEAKQREELKRMEHIQSIHTKAKALRLTTTMLGRSPTALINEQVLQTGDLINGFRIKSISSDCCVVVMEGVEVELQMVE